MVVDISIKLELSVEDFELLFSVSWLFLFGFCIVRGGFKVGECSWFIDVDDLVVKRGKLCLIL